MRRWLVGPALVLALTLAPFAAQAQNFVRLAQGVTTVENGAKILLAPLDVELFNITAGGVLEPRAEWTQAAERFMKQALIDRMGQSKLELVQMPPDVADAHAEALHLHAAVANAISTHHTSAGPFRLPTKEGKLDWDFGDVFKGLAEKTGARYGLFTLVRDGYASAERKAMMVGAAILGAFTGFVVIPGGGQQVGYATLVDLHTGRAVWFNRLQRSSGDLREQKPAEETVQTLLTEAPFPATPTK